MCVCETENTAIQICLHSQDLIVRDLVGDKSLLLAIGGTHLSIKLLSQPEFCGRGQTPEQTGVHRATRAAPSSSIINIFFNDNNNDSNNTSLLINYKTYNKQVYH